MPHRVISLLVAVVMCVATLPLGRSSAAAEPVRPSPQREIMIDQPPPTEDGNPYTEEYGTSYWASGQPVRLYAFSVESDTYYVPTSDGGWDERMDYFYGDGQVDRTSGPNLGYAVYEADRPANVNLAHFTFNGGTAVVDLVSEQLYPPSAADAAAIDAWASTSDAQLAIDAITTHLASRSGYEDPAPLINFDLLALALEPGQADTSAKRARPQKREEKGGLVAGLVKAQWSPVEGFVQPCSTTPGGAPDGYSVMNVSYSPRPAAQCFGCCGPRCNCIPDLSGRPIYGSVCRAHDACIQGYGGAVRGTLLNPTCGALFAGSVVYVMWRRLPPTLIVRSWR